MGNGLANDVVISFGVIMDGPLQRVGDFGALLRATQTAQTTARSTVEQKRQLVADLCRMLGHQAQTSTASNAATPAEPLSPRLSQTLDALLAGDSEKQIAQKLSISQHTVHVYVKALYKGFGVSSRGELLSRFIRQRTPEAASVRGAHELIGR